MCANKRRLFFVKQSFFQACIKKDAVVVQQINRKKNKEIFAYTVTDALCRFGDSPHQMDNLSAQYSTQLHQHGGIEKIVRYVHLAKQHLANARSVQSKSFAA